MQVHRFSARSGAYVMAEGDTFSYQTFDGNIERQKFKAWTHRIEVQADLPPEQLQPEMEKKFREMTEAAGCHFETSLFDTVREATKKTGLGFNAGGKPFHPSMLWEVLEKMDVDFDKSGEPILPTLVVHPDVFKAIEHKITLAGDPSTFEIALCFLLGPALFLPFGIPLEDDSPEMQAGCLVR